MPDPSEKLKTEVLQFLYSKDPIRLTPNNIAENIGYSSDYTGSACRELAGEGLIERSSGGGDPFYSLTDKGREYLAGDLDASELEESD